MPDLRDTPLLGGHKQESARPMLEHGIIAETPASYNDLVYVILPEFDPDQAWGPYRWTHNGTHIPQSGDDCLVAYSNRREGWVIAWWSGTYAP